LICGASLVALLVAVAIAGATVGSGVGVGLVSGVAVGAAVDCGVGAGSTSCGVLGICTQAHSSAAVSKVGKMRRRIDIKSP